MLRTILGEEYSPVITYQTNKGDIKEAIYSYKKIELLNSKRETIGVPLEKVFSEFYHSHVRNAFSHSQYFFTEDATFNISKNFSPTSSEVFKAPKKQHFYSADEIEQIFLKTLIYFETFRTVAISFIKPYMDGASYPTLYGDIYYSTQFGWGFDQQRKS